MLILVILPSVAECLEGVHDLAQADGQVFSEDGQGGHDLLKLYWISVDCRLGHESKLGRC